MSSQVQIITHTQIKCAIDKKDGIALDAARMAGGGLDYYHLVNCGPHEKCFLFHSSILLYWLSVNQELAKHVASNIRMSS